MNSFLTIAGFGSEAVAIPQSGFPTWAEIDGLIEEGWSRRASRYDISYRRSSDQCTISIWTLEVPEVGNVAAHWDAWVLVSERSDTDSILPLSGIALGDRSKCYKSLSGDSLHVSIGSTFVRVFARYKIVGPPENRVVVCDDPLGDAERIEGGARHAIAKLQARDYAVGPVTVVNGSTINTTLRDSYGTMFVSLDGWAQARGIALNKNKRRGTLAFLHRNKEHVAALGTDQIKFETSWKTMGSMAVRKGDTWYVPLNGVEATVR